jgi:exopolysaccharide biosynthesis polyprenyl glycosylphosphotransferase
MSAAPQVASAPDGASNHAETLPASRLAAPSLHDLVATRQNIGRTALVWLVTYATFRWWLPAPQAALDALVATVVVAAVRYRIGQSFRSMTFAVGTYLVALATAAVSAAALSALAFWVPALPVPRASVPAVALASLLAVALWDSAVKHAARAPSSVLIVGGGPQTVRLLDDLAREPEIPLRVIGVVSDHVDPRLDGRAPHGGALDALPEVVRELNPDLIVVAVQTGRPEVFAQLLGVADAGFQVMGLPETYEVAFGRLPVEDLTSAWFMSILHAYNRPSNVVGKRLFDIVVSLVGLVVTVLLLPLIAPLVKSTRGPLVYRQERLGEHGRVFTILKFRTMRVDAEAAGEAVWAAEHDPRITGGGRILRLLRLDELPQLWNVLRGEMSIVGPRPERPQFSGRLSAGVPFWMQRHLLKPGITGWAQIRAGYAADELGTVEKLAYDLWYLRHRSLTLDAVICAKTLPRMAFFRGAR